MRYVRNYTPIKPTTTIDSVEAWGKTIIFSAIKEYLAVTAALLCYSRVGVTDYMYSGMCLYVILVVFSFPILNPYLFMFMRLGPWAKWDVIINKDESQVTSWTNTFVRYLIHITITLVGQLLGSVTAAHIRNKLDTVYNEYVPIPEVNSTVTTDDMHTKYVMDEMFCVAFLLIGLTHLIQCYHEIILGNVYWNKKNTTAVAPDSDVPTGAIDTDDCAAESYAQVQDAIITTFNNPQNPSRGIAGNLIASACVFVSCLSVAFPSAHQSLHVTIYLASREHSILGDQEELYRIIGGISGTLIALVYYYMFYAKNYPPIRKLFDIQLATGAKVHAPVKRVPIDFKGLI